MPPKQLDNIKLEAQGETMRRWLFLTLVAVGIVFAQPQQPSVVPSAEILRVTGDPTVCNAFQFKYNTTNGKLFGGTRGSTACTQIGGGGGGTPGGSSGQLQYNNAGAFGGMSGTRWINSSRSLEILDALNNSSLLFNSSADAVALFSINDSISMVAPTVATTPGHSGSYIGLIAASGGNTSITTTGVGGGGGDVTIFSGRGGSAPSALTSSTGGIGGPINVQAGSGGAASSGVASTGGKGGDFQLLAGAGGLASGAGTNEGGASGSITIQALPAGDATGGTSNTGGTGGFIDLMLGSGGLGSTANGFDGMLRVWQGARGNRSIQRWLTAAGTTLSEIDSTGAGFMPNLLGMAVTPGISGCSATLGTGAKELAGTFTSGTNGMCTVTLTFVKTAPNGWACAISNQTTANLTRQTASTTTTVTFAGLTVPSDVLSYFCGGY